MKWIMLICYPKGHTHHSITLTQEERSGAESSRIQQYRQIQKEPKIRTVPMRNWTKVTRWSGGEEACPANPTSPKSPERRSCPMPPQAGGHDPNCPGTAGPRVGKESHPPFKCPVNRATCVGTSVTSEGKYILKQKKQKKQEADLRAERALRRPD